MSSRAPHSCQAQGAPLGSGEGPRVCGDLPLLTLNRVGSRRQVWGLPGRERRSPCNTSIRKSGARWYGPIKRPAPSCMGTTQVVTSEGELWPGVGAHRGGGPAMLQEHNIFHAVL